MADDVRASKARNRILYVANRGSDSESDDDQPYGRRLPSTSHYQAQYSYQPPPLPPQPSPPNPKPLPQITTAMMPPPSAGYQTSHLSLSSPSSTSSHAADESTPPPTTPNVLQPPFDLKGEGQSNLDPVVVAHADRVERNDAHPQNYYRPHYPAYNSTPRLPSQGSSQRDSMSPTTPDSYGSNSSYASSSTTVASKVSILVTLDSERYVTVDISGAKDAAFIKECIFTKLNIYDDSEQQHYAIYRTEIGAYALGDALPDDRLFDLCRREGDSKGGLKFFVSHENAPVHEPPTPQSAISPPATIPPPVLPQATVPSYAPLQPLRRSRSRHGSVSSASEHPPEVAAGYEADVDNNESNHDRRPVRPLPTLSSSLPVSSILSPPAVNGQRYGNRPTSPLPSRPSSPPHARPEALVSPSTTIDRYGKEVPIPPPPPPLSPRKTSFEVLDEDSNITPPATRMPHVRSASDATAQLEQLMSMNPTPPSPSPHNGDDEGRHSRNKASQGGRARHDWKENSPIRRIKRHLHDKEESNRSESWVLVEASQFSDPASPKQSPSTSRTSRNYLHPQRYKPTSYASRGLGLNLPPAPRVAAPVPPSSGDVRTPPSRQHVPAQWPVTWKGEEKGGQKPLPPSQPQWSRLTKTAKSMDNLRSSFNHPATLQPGARRTNGQLPMSRPSNPSTRDLAFASSSPGQNPTTSASRPPIRALPSQARPFQHSTSYEPSPTRLPVQSGGLSSPPEPFPRPSSATGDHVISPTSRLTNSSAYGRSESSDSTRSPRAMSPIRQLPLPGGTNGRLFQPMEAVVAPPRTPLPQSPPMSPTSPRNSHGTDFAEDSSTSTLMPSCLLDMVNHASESTVMPPMAHNASHNSNASQQSNASHNSNASLASTTSYNSTTSFNSTTSYNSSATVQSSSATLISSDGYSDDGASESGTCMSMWQKPPSGNRPKSVSRGPPLKVQIDAGGEVRPLQIPSARSSTPPSSRSDQPPPSPLYHDSHRRQARGSTFTDMRKETWAPRPPPEMINERLEEFFPEHDLDKPVIEAVSGGSSPTAEITAAPIPQAPAPPMVSDYRRKNKKSIRKVVEEGNRRVSDAIQRKRSTKLWGSRLEEVTSSQARISLQPPLPESPSGAATFKWVRGELIGRGTYGRVYLALNATTGEMIAVKQVEIPQTASDKNDSRQVTVVQALKSESETLKDLDHPHIVQYLGFEETPTNLSIFLEYVPGGSIGSCLLKHGKFDEDVTKSFTGQILSGLEYLHSKGILHRDLKADNILVETTGICKISDFGISKRTDNDQAAMTAMQGTVFWMAPEVINTQKKGYNFKVDIWSVGCVVLEMWAGSRPWLGDEAVAVMFKLYQSKQPPPVPDDVHLSELADDFRRKCFAINPDDRPPASELRRHPYLTLPPGWVFNGFK
ncbi:MAP kinase [Schizophyllum commune]